MAKVKLSDLMRNADARARGRFNIAATPNGAVAKAWPRKRGKAKSGYDFYRQQEFGLAAQYASSPLDLDLFTATEMAKGTEQVPRDILQMALYGYYYILVFPNGEESIPAREMTNNVQYILDLLDPPIGAVIVRQEIGWIAIPPGQIGDVLTIVTGLPAWAPNSGGSGGAARIEYPPTDPGSGSSATGSRAVALTPTFDTVLNAFRVRGAWTAGAQIGVKVFTEAAGKLGTLIAEIAPVTCPNTATYDLDLEADDDIQLVAGTKYWFICWKVGGTGNYTSGARITSGQWLTLSQSAAQAGAYTNSGEPVSGNTLNTGGSPLAITLIKK